MKEFKSRKFIFIILFVAVLVANIVPVLIFRDKAAITKYSIPAIGLAVFSIIHGFVSYIFRHKGNFLRINFWLVKNAAVLLFYEDEDYTFSIDYNKRFNGLLFLYCIVIPFYIPFIFFTKTAVIMPFAIIVFLLPQIVFGMMEIKQVKSNIQRYQTKKQQIEAERTAQERRESMGEWK